MSNGASSSKRRKRVLAIDDEPAMTEWLKMVIEAEGFEVRTALIGTRGEEIFKQWRPDVIVTDLMLPDIDGFGVCEILRHQTATATIPIIILTAWATSDARHIGLDLGALDYVTKPFSPRDLVERVQRLLNLRPATHAGSGS